MLSYSRKEFLQTSAVLGLGAFLPFRSIHPAASLNLSFSTLGCPDWTFGQTIEFAAKNGYTGIEMRGIQRELDLTKCKEFIDESSRKATLKLVRDKQLKFVCLGSSTNLHIQDATERKRNLDDGRKFIDLASQLECPNVRVFPNSLPKELDRDATLERIGSGLLELGEYAKDKAVSVLMETHGDLVHTEDLEKVMQIAKHSNTGLVWDVSNMWTVTKESPAVVYPKLKNYIRHTHIKDAKLADGKINYVFLGQGEVPIFEALDILSAAGYKGFYSFEWEKLWHPEIADPELALADYPLAMKKHFKLI